MTKVEILKENSTFQQQKYEERMEKPLTSKSSTLIETLDETNLFIITQICLQLHHHILTMPHHHQIIQMKVLIEQHMQEQQY